jgi:hemerythrin-like domain-containing protein
MRLSKAAAGQRPLEETVDEFLAFYPADLLRHFREEEEVLGSLMADRCGEDDAQRVRLFTEHAALHELVRTLEEARRSGVGLSTAAGAAGDFLERHIRFEERELFPRLEALLTDGELLALAPHFGGGPHCPASTP